MKKIFLITATVVAIGFLSSCGPTKSLTTDRKTGAFMPVTRQFLTDYPFKLSQLKGIPIFRNGSDSVKIRATANVEKYEVDDQGNIRLKDNSPHNDVWIVPDAIGVLTDVDSTTTPGKFVFLISFETGEGNQTKKESFRYAPSDDDNKGTYKFQSDDEGLTHFFNGLPYKVTKGKGAQLLIDEGVLDRHAKIYYGVK